MPSRRSNRTRGTRPDRYRPDLRARAMQPGPPKRVSGGVKALSVTINQTAAGACTFSGAATDCLATGTYEAQVGGSVAPPVTYLWEITAGTATIVSPTDQTTDVQTTASADTTFTLKVTVTDDEGKVASATQEYTHTHTDLDLIDTLITGDGDDLITGDGDQLVAA